MNRCHQSLTIMSARLAGAAMEVKRGDVPHPWGAPVSDLAP